MRADPDAPRACPSPRRRERDQRSSHSARQPLGRPPHPLHPLKPRPVERHRVQHRASGLRPGAAAEHSAHPDLTKQIALARHPSSTGRPLARRSPARRGRRCGGRRSRGAPAPRPGPAPAPGQQVPADAVDGMVGIDEHERWRQPVQPPQRALQGTAYEQHPVGHPVREQRLAGAGLGPRVDVDRHDPAAAALLGAQRQDRRGAASEGPDLQDRARGRPGEAVQLVLVFGTQLAGNP